MKFLTLSSAPAIPLEMGLRVFHRSPVDTSPACLAFMGLVVKMAGSRATVVAPIVLLSLKAFLSLCAGSDTLSDDPLPKIELKNLFFDSLLASCFVCCCCLLSDLLSIGIFSFLLELFDSFLLSLLPLSLSLALFDVIFSRSFSFLSVAMRGLSSSTAKRVAVTNFAALISSSTTLVLPNLPLDSLRRWKTNSSFQEGHDSFLDVVSNFSLPGKIFTYSEEANVWI